MDYTRLLSINLSK